MPPPHPPHMVMPDIWWIFTGLMFVVLAVGVALLTRYSWKHADWTPLLCVVSGAVGVFLEPLVDVAGLAWYPPEAGWSYAQTAGITLPGLTLPGYTWIYGAFAGLTYCSAKGMTTTGRCVRLPLGHGTPTLFRALVVPPAQTVGGRAGSKS